MGWLFLFLAACMEIVGATGLKLFSLKKNFINLTVFIGGFVLSYFLLYKSLDYLNMSIAYSVWAGTGTAGAVIINMLLFNETKSLLRIINVLLIITGVVGLKLVS